MLKKILIGIGVAIVLIIGYWLISPLSRNINLNETIPDKKQIILAQAKLEARAHDVSGEAKLIQVGQANYLRFENLKTINGPDLRIYLSTGLTADKIVDLGPIRATTGNVNYLIPAGTDLNTYKYALIWCRAFSVLFSDAQFQ